MAKLKKTIINIPRKFIKNILIIAPHYPPSNLAAVHRSRLFALHLPEFGWEPIILTVDEKYYEEALDWNLHKLLPVDQRIEKVKAFAVTKPRLIGDIGLRAFFQIRKKALELVQKEKIDFVYIPIPSFYTALIGPYLHRKTGVKYGIDYIDPWVHHFPGSNKKFSRHWFSKKLAGFLEPIAIKEASLITGVAEGYYLGVIERNPELIKKTIFGAMPYGGEKDDHEAVAKLSLQSYLFKKNGKFQFVYAGAMLPKAYEPLKQLFASIKDNPNVFNDVEFHFVGTGYVLNDPSSFNIKPHAIEYGLWEKNVFEYPQRIPYLDVLVHLENASAVFVLGSTEPHYTPSKVYQGILAKKAIIAVLHNESSAASVIERSNAGLVLKFDGEKGLADIKGQFASCMSEFKNVLKEFKPENINMELFNQYSANAVTQQLVTLLNKIVP